ncbi:hypothetical protein GOY07_01465 [Wolbachia endosymbiont of Litomosoides sigmodontis]|uniref:hypothetical protein n=1 Tax=Wolbachia endosymbiont of Litomosoides sigmodontis TaxID=80850 RepID=UPI0015891FE7|nr:hypothetical protein [Wolbachia endosymbiont of Litomosoides sigmodontis]QKX02886.1 hypothetical protein GOY07_01465 [Wolbachia endosymbiont of Litomosoides sigmodontis]
MEKKYTEICRMAKFSNDMKSKLLDEKVVKSAKEMLKHICCKKTKCCNCSKESTV